MSELNKFKVGDKVKRDVGNNNRLMCGGYVGVVTAVSPCGEWISVDNMGEGDDACPFAARFFELVSPAEDISTPAENISSNETGQHKTGGSTPAQYRISLNLPLTEDRNKYVDVDLEAVDVIDALDLSGNLKDVQKALFRMGKKDGTSDAYDLNKCLFYILREMKKRGIISHAKFWQVSEGLTKLLEE